MRRIGLIVLFNLLIYSSIFAIKNFYPISIVDKPNTNLVGYNCKQFNISFVGDNLILNEVIVNVNSSLDLGLSMNYKGLMGDEKFKIDSWIGIKARYLVAVEGVSLPSVAIGFDNQLKGKRFRGSDYDRSYFKSTGLYIVASKTFSKYVLLSGGINYSFDESSDKAPNLFFGSNFSIGRYFGFDFEYDFAFNDNQTKFAKNKGYLNIQIRINPIKNLCIVWGFRDLLKNNEGREIVNKFLGLKYVWRYF